MSVYETDFDGSCLENSRPSLPSISLALMFHNGDASSLVAYCVTRMRNARAAAWTAEPALVAEHEPPEVGAFGRRLSPSITRTFDGSTLSSSAAVWVRIG